MFGRTKATVNYAGGAFRWGRRSRVSQTHAQGVDQQLYCTEVAVALLATKAPSFTLGKGKLEEFHGSIHHAFIPRCADYVVLGEQGH